MIYQHSVLRKIQAGIMILLTAFSLSGCAGQRQEIEEAEMKEPEMVMETAQTGEQEADGAEEIEEAEEPPAGSDNLNVPQNKAPETSSSVNVDIHNEAEYRGFVSSLEEYLDCDFLIIGMQETDTVIYLDEILAYQNFKTLQICGGGIISARDMDNLKENPLKNIELSYVYAIEENILSQMSALQNIEIVLNSSYVGVSPIKELVHNTDCDNIAMVWRDDKKYEVHLEELAEWDEISTALLENSSYLKGLYVQNEDDYNYISYEFCEEGTENACDIFICIRDRESYGEKYFDIVKVPVESIDYMTWHSGRRMGLEDLNFDGYRDLIFMGWNRMYGGYTHCIGFLWNEKEQRYEWNATVPKYIDWVDDKRKRITHTNPNCNYEGDNIYYDDYRIYEYHDGVFIEKRLKVMFPNQGLIWQYYEEGELLKRLESNYDEEAKLYYITYEENGIVTEKVMEEADYDNKYGYFHDLGKEYFPEFDFYWAG